MTRAVIYARFSPRRNADQCQSAEHQLQACRELCAAEGWEVAGEHVDEKASRNDEDRPGLWDALAGLKRGGVLVVYRRDRLASGLLASVIQRQVDKSGGRIHCVEGGSKGDTPESRMMDQILDAVAEYERQLIAARTRAAMLRHQAGGRRMSCRLPFGWRRHPENPARMMRDHDEQLVLQRIVRAAQAGRGTRSIARGLEEMGIKCRGRKTWHHLTIRRILDRAGVD